MSAQHHYGSPSFQKVAGLEGDLHDLFIDGLDLYDADVIDCKREIDTHTIGLSPMERIIARGIGLKYWAARPKDPDQQIMVQEQIQQHQAIMEEQLLPDEMQVAQQMVASIRLVPVTVASVM